jgi:hypothetical protein
MIPSQRTHLGFGTRVFVRRRSVRYFLLLSKEVGVRVASQVELTDFLGLRYATISWVVNAVDKNQDTNVTL